MRYSITMYLPCLCAFSLTLHHPQLVTIGLQVWEHICNYSERLSWFKHWSDSCSLPFSLWIPTSSATLDKWIISLMYSAFSLLSKPDFGIWEELLLYNRKCQGAHFFSSFFTSWVTEGDISYNNSYIVNWKWTLFCIEGSNSKKYTFLYYEKMGLNCTTIVTFCRLHYPDLF